MTGSSKDGNVERASRLDTATLSDALDRLGVVGQCYRLKPCAPTFRLTGRAFTLLYGPAANPPGTVGDFIDDVPQGYVVAIDNGGRTDATIWGDILTEVAHRRKLAGTVIDGINRDVGLCRELNYPIYSRDNWMRTGKDRVQIEGVNVAVTLGGARAMPGDIIRGDADGAVIVPGEHEDNVLDIAEEIESAEQQIRAAIRGGMRLDQARQEFKYHYLQTRPK